MIQKESIQVTEANDKFNIVRTIEEDVTGVELLKIVEEIRKGLENHIKQKEETEKAINTLKERLEGFEKHLAKAKELELKNKRRPVGTG